ncbi:hypothetical protein BC826DRAFT_911984 [Russula brevipes]|nr:hypothetical protein BC826DRAFT_911984 [Russula brevipes]
MVNIHLRQIDGPWICALAIPPEDIGRLSLRPLKWLRFVAFAALGVKGHLYDSPGGNIVNYGHVSLADLADNYYFSPEGAYQRYHLVDPHSLNDRTTTSVLTLRRFDFRGAVALRDGDCCVVTRTDAPHCDAAHIIPHSKGDEYIQRVVTDRRLLYSDDVSSMDINSTQNGMFLTKDLHSRFGKGQSQFLKTPNFALDTTDIPRVETGPMPLAASRVTMQHIIPAVGLDRVLQRDVMADWSGPSAPPSILLDFMYGIAVIKRWAVDGLRQMLDERHNDRFRDIPLIPRSDRADEDEDDGDIEPDDTSGGDYEPHGVGCHHRIHHKSEESELSRALDDAFYLAMIFRPAPPGVPTAGEIQEERSRQEGREKVQRWLEASEPSLLFYWV